MFNYIEEQIQELENQRLINKSADIKAIKNEIDTLEIITANLIKERKVKEAKLEKLMNGQAEENENDK